MDKASKKRLYFSIKKREREQFRKLEFAFRFLQIWGDYSHPEALIFDSYGYCNRLKERYADDIQSMSRLYTNNVIKKKGFKYVRFKYFKRKIRAI